MQEQETGIAKIHTTYKITCWYGIYRKKMVKISSQRSRKLAVNAVLFANRAIDGMYIVIVCVVVLSVATTFPMRATL